MGWKNVKEAYQIKHIMHVSEAGIIIGYSPDVIVIDFTGKIVKRCNSYEMEIYQKEMDADPLKLKNLVESSDTFEKSIPVFSCNKDNYEIIEKQCEVLGYPNLTHDGELMHSNTHSTSRALIVQEAKETLEFYIGKTATTVADLEISLAKEKQKLAHFKLCRQKLV